MIIFSSEKTDIAGSPFPSSNLSPGASRCRAELERGPALIGSEEHVRRCTQACCNGQQARCMPEPTGAKRISARLPPIRRHGPPLPGTDRPQAAGSNIPSNIALGNGSTGFVEGLVKATGRGGGR